MELFYERVVRLAPLRAVALALMGIGALLVPDFLERMLGPSAVAYLALNGLALAVGACMDGAGPKRLANRVELLAACGLLLLAGVAAALMQQLQIRVVLYLILLLVEGTVYLAAAVWVARSRMLMLLAAVLVAGSSVWMLLSPFGGLAGIGRYTGVLLLLSALWEGAARLRWRWAIP